MATIAACESKFLGHRVRGSLDIEPVLGIGDGLTAGDDDQRASSYHEREYEYHGERSRLAS